MYKYRCLNPIAAVGLKGFSDNYTEANEGEAADVILVRSAKMHDMEFDSTLKAIGRAGAGVNNIPLDRCAEEGIVVFNAPGANANGVKELFIFSAIASIRDIMGGIAWTGSESGNPDIAALTEKEKKRFVGHEIMGKTLAVIGLGAIGVKVANVAIDLGMSVKGYDPYLNDTMKAALNPAVEIAASNEDAVAGADFITIHIPALDSTKGMINEALLAKAKDGVVVMNLARDTLVDIPSIKAALESGRVSRYVCDFPTAEASTLPNTILIPHLGASTEEAEDNCAIMAVNELKDYIDNGNIKNSVNYPQADLGAACGPRITVCHKSAVDGAAIANAIKGAGAQIKDMVSKTRGDFAYSMFDVDNAEAAKAVEGLDGVIRVRTIM